MEQRDTHRAQFEDFVRIRWDAAARLAWGLTLDSGYAEDLTQEAFARLWPRWRRLSAEDPVAYLNRTMVNLFLSEIRRRRLKERLRPLVRSTTNDPMTEVAERDALVRAMRRLSPQQQVVLVLRYVEDMPVDEVASLLGCSVGTVKTHASRGRKAMRELLDPSAKGAVT